MIGGVGVYNREPSWVHKMTLKGYDGADVHRFAMMYNIPTIIIYPGQRDHVDWDMVHAHVDRLRPKSGIWPRFT